MLSPTPLLKARSARADCSWRGPLGFIYLQGWRFKNSVFQFWYAIILSVRKVFMCPLMEFPVLQFCTLPSVFSLDAILSLSSFFPNYPILHTLIKSLLSLLFPWLNDTSTLSVSLCFRCSYSLIVFDPLLDLLHMFMSLLYSVSGLLSNVQVVVLDVKQEYLEN